MKQISTGTHGHMAKTKKQIIEDLKLIDIIIEVLDARAPKASENPDVKEYCKNKRRIVVLNKSDLADELVTSQWIEYYKNNKIPCIKVDSKSGKGVNEVINQIKIEYKEVEKKYIEKGRSGRPARVMILGIPNVGKSTLINSLAKKNIAKVGNKPGLTKEKQWIKLENNIELMDTPGMLWPKLNDDITSMHLSFINTIGENAVDNEEVSFYLLKYLLENYKEKIEERYGIVIEESHDINNKEMHNIKDNNDNETVEYIRNEIATKKGAILSGGRINEQKLSDMILTDFRTGKFGKISLEKP